MTLRLHSASGFSKKAGLWLRCFLGTTMVVLPMILCLCSSARANVCVYKTLHILRVRGNVTDYLGEKIPGVKLTLRNDGKISLESAADQQGVFNLKVPPGKYWLTIEAPGFAPGRAYLQVGFGFKSLFHPGSIHMILSPGVVCRMEPRDAGAANRRFQS